MLIAYSKINGNCFRKQVHDTTTGVMRHFTLHYNVELEKFTMYTKIIYNIILYYESSN